MNSPFLNESNSAMSKSASNLKLQSNETKENNDNHIENNIDRPTNKFEHELIIPLIKETLYNSTAQTIIKICQTKHQILKFFLLIFILTTSGICAYLIVDCIMTFLQFNVITTSRTYFETPSLFPTITICNYNIFSTDFAYNFLYKLNVDFRHQVFI